LRAFAFDPIISREVETSGINEVTLNIAWDKELGTGPVDTYLEVVDYDPAGRTFYPPVDLMDPHLLAQDGLSPSEGNPQFHQQMAYAVARTTIGHFESALGRRILWRPRRTKKNGEYYEEYVERLRIYPHALREANAYYSPEKIALLFGYFPASSSHYGTAMPGETVFTCLSHDIVAHETTHAIVDGLHVRFIEPSNADVWAFHEALSDIVALFQHFSYSDVLKHQIAKTRGDLEKQNILGELAFQFGQATGRYGALRSAIGSIDPVTKKWVPKEPDPSELARATEPHMRGAILVAAVFDAFLTIYKSRVRDLIRIASGGTGILPEGEISPDLVNRLAQEAAKTARHMLQMCIRALDYCPPVDIDYGDYLRALITADIELVTDDRHNYRLAVIEAFRQRGIFPGDIRNLSAESLIWHVPDEKEQKLFRKVLHGPEGILTLVPDWDSIPDRSKIYETTRESSKKLHDWFTGPAGLPAAPAAHIVLKDAPPSVYRSRNGLPALEIHSVRPAFRIGPDGRTVTELVIEMTQRRRGYLDVKMQERVDSGQQKNLPEADFIMRGGCTLLVDPRTAEVRYCIYKDILSKNRLDRMREYLIKGSVPSLRAAYYGNPGQEYYRQHIAQETGRGGGIEPFALLHRWTGIPEAE
jgi:hypothetical protein